LIFIKSCLARCGRVFGAFEVSWRRQFEFVRLKDVLQWRFVESGRLEDLLGARLDFLPPK
jgi:hypothetical protein